jgi:transposase
MDRAILILSDCSHKVAKHFHLEITDNSFHYERHSENIAAEAALDGLYVIRTSVSEQLFDSQETVRAYKSLSTVERAFRSYKTVDLKVRPICHRLEGRVRAHIFLCMLAYYVEWHMRSSLVTMLFDDEDKVLAEALRDSVVAPKKRSVKAQSKAVHKRTEDALPVHSFQTLLKDLATIVKNRVQPKLPGAKVAFEKITCPTPLQQKAFDLLGVSYLM